MTQPDNDPAGASRRAFLHARMIDPQTGYDGPGGVFVVDGVIAASGPEVTRDNLPGDCPVRDCQGRLLLPGLIDMRVFTGEPGNEHRETLRSASLAAAAGGVTTMIVMPNTNPIIDNAAIVDFISRRARDTAQVRVRPMAAITRGLEGALMSEYGLLKQAGAVALTDGDRAVANSRVMRHALEYAGDFGLLVVQHAEDGDLSSGVMHEGEISTRLGLPGIPEAAELITIDRDIRLVELTGAPYHAGQISAAATLEVVRAAKNRGLPVSCGVSVNNLVLNHTDIGRYRTFFKLSPPLRSEDDRRVLVEGVADGSIDVIVSDHNPQNVDTKRVPFSQANSGAIGLETMFSAALSLYHAGAVPLIRLITAMTAAPARLLGLDGGGLSVGAPADLTIADLNITWRADAQALHSLSKNTCFENRYFSGRAIETVVAGRTIYTYDHNHAAMN